MTAHDFVPIRTMMGLKIQLESIALLSACQPHRAPSRLDAKATASPDTWGLGWAEQGTWDTRFNEVLTFGVGQSLHNPEKHILKLCELGTSFNPLFPSPEVPCWKRRSCRPLPHSRFQTGSDRWPSGFTLHLHLESFGTVSQTTVLHPNQEASAPCSPAVRRHHSSRFADRKTFRKIRLSFPHVFLGHQILLTLFLWYLPLLLEPQLLF